MPGQCHCRNGTPTRLALNPVRHVAVDSSIGGSGGTKRGPGTICCISSCFGHNRAVVATNLSKNEVSANRPKETAPLVRSAVAPEASISGQTRGGLQGSRMPDMKTGRPRIVYDCGARGSNGSAWPGDRTVIAAWPIHGDTEAEGVGFAYIAGYASGCGSGLGTGSEGSHCPGGPPRVGQGQQGQRGAGHRGGDSCGSSRGRTGDRAGRQEHPRTSDHCAGRCRETWCRLSDLRTGSSEGHGWCAVGLALSLHGGARPGYRGCDPPASAQGKGLALLPPERGFPPVVRVGTPGVLISG